MNKTLSGTLAANVAPLGTFVVSYPALTAPEFPGGVTDSGYFARTRLHTLVVAGAKYENPQGFSLTLGTANITVTNRSANTWPAGAPFVLELAEPGKNVYVDQGLSGTGNRVARMYRADAFRINLGAPDAAVAAGICASQSVGLGVDALINGSLASGGAAVLDTPRNVVAAWTTTAVCTVRGFDEYGNAMTESSASGTTFAGRKAFKRVTRVTFSVAVTGATVGTGDVLGLPVYLPSTGWVLRELQDGVAATAGTTVAGDVTAGGSTALTGDVRGTYDPNAACDGARAFELVVALAEPGDLGMSQFAG